MEKYNKTSDRTKNREKIRGYRIRAERPLTRTQQKRLRREETLSIFESGMPDPLARRKRGATSLEPLSELELATTLYIPGIGEE